MCLLDALKSHFRPISVSLRWLKMGWGCKRCKFETSTKTDLLKHYRLCHGHDGQPQPCLYQDCFCSFTAIDHIYQEITLRRLSIESDLLKVSLSLASLALPAQSPQKENFLDTLVNKKHETVTHVFKNCNLSTNIYGTFASHRS